ncbi:MAG: hypothetical protein JXA96_04835 [Sedimentisphaerales bacterium]|nr:hypothetical protein [Sedimentisphaerales bacterium]
MNNKKTQIIHIIAFLCIILAFLITCTAAFAQSENIIQNNNTDPNIQKTFTVQHIDPNTAAKVAKTIIKLKIFEISQETLIVPNQEKKLLTVRAANSHQIALIAEIVKNIDFEVINEGMINKKYIKLEKLVFDDIYKIISPIFSNYGHASYNITARILEVTEITDNLDNFENLIIKLDTDGFYNTDSTPDTDIIDTTNPVEPNQDASLLIPEQTDTNSIAVQAADVNEPMIVIQFHGLRIEQIAERLQQWTGKEVIPSKEAMNLRFSVFAPERMKQSDAIALLYSAMRQQGFITEETDDTIYIKNAPSQPDNDTLSYDEPLENIPDKDKVVRKIFKLQYEKPSTIGQLISSYLSPSGYFTADDTTKTLLVKDAIKYLIRIEEMIKVFDSDPNSGIRISPVNPIDPNNKAQREEYDAIYVKFIDAELAAVKLKDILLEMEFDTKNKLIILPLATSKQILVFGENKDDRELAESLIHDIDYQAAEESYDFENISLNYIEPQAFTNFVTNTIEEFKNLRLSLYPIAPSKQILVFGGKEYRDVIKKYAEDIDILVYQGNN